MHTTLSTRFRSASHFPALLAVVILTLSGSVAADENVSQWSDQVWDTAMTGNAERLVRELDEIPSGQAADDISRLRERVDLYHQHVKETKQHNQNLHDEAMTELRDKLANDEMTDALVAAVKAQTHSRDMDAALSDPDIKALIDRASTLAEQAEQNGDWLTLQDYYYSLRTLYEDTHHHREFTKYDQNLERVSRRLALLARYAPRQFYKLRRSRALELDPESEIPPYNDDFADDWRERLDGITQPILRNSLQKVARMHIDNGGWQPLMHGGLEALRILGTTEMLKANFANLGDPGKVNRWIATIDQIQREVDDENWRGSRRKYDRIITRLLVANDQSIGVPKEVVYREFGNGATNQLDEQFGDEFSEIIWPDRQRRFKQQVEGNFVGVGILIQHNEKREIVVVNPLEGMPAYRAGVKPDDIIAEVDGNSTAGWSLNDAVDKITGPEGEEVVLGLQRKGEEELVQIRIVRDEIRLYSVNGWHKLNLDAETGEPVWDWYIDKPSGIGYIRMTAFNDNTFGELKTAIREMKNQGTLRGLILDLRYNPGGLLPAAYRISNMFVRNGTIVTGEDKYGREQMSLEANPTNAALADLPTVVIVNKGSASASEIVSGSLQAHDAAVIVGTRTFGKGSVQTVHPVSANASLKLTTQHYVLPGGRLVHRKAGAEDWGVNPDLLVEMSPDQIEKSVDIRRKSDAIPEGDDGMPDPDAESRGDVNDLLESGVDPQLEMALMVLQARTLKHLEQKAIARSN